MGLLKLAISRQTKRLVVFNGSAQSLPPLYQTNTQQFRIQVVDDPVGFGAAYTAVDCTALSLRMVIAVNATGSSGDSSEYLLAAAYEGAWAWDDTEEAFFGEINLNTAPIAAFIDASAFKPAILEINLIDTGIPETIFGHSNGAPNVTLAANADELGAVVPEVLDDPPTIAIKTLEDGVGGVSITDNIVEVTGLGLGFAPSYFLVFINAPSGSGAIAGNFIVGSGSSDGFSVVLSAIPENDNYTLTYIPVA